MNLTPLIPLSFKGEGEEILEEGLAPLLDAPKMRRVIKTLRLSRHLSASLSLKKVRRKGV